MDRVCRRYLVSGRVQGVYFRGSTRREALALGLTGVARNLADGRVEVIVCGAPRRLDELARWLRRGPPSARVAALDCEPCDDPGLEGFRTA